MFSLRWSRSSRRRPDLQFVLFTRQGCHLCDEAWTLLSETQKRYGVSLEVHDVDTRADWVAQFGECVPVVLVNGKVRFRGRVNPILLQRFLDAPETQEPV